jgi:transglutaminase-like putative cysteine protease
MSAPMRYQVRHQTVYAYAGTVAHAHHLLHLTPRATATQICREHTLEIWPPPALRVHHVDAFGNQATRLELDRAHECFEVTARMNVELRSRPEPAEDASLPWEAVRDGLRYMAAPMAARPCATAPSPPSSRSSACSRSSGPIASRSAYRCSPARSP